MAKQFARARGGDVDCNTSDENSHGHQFWIGKILEVLTHEIEHKIKSIKVHWYNTRSQNAFTGKYTLEMIECPRTRGGRKRKRNIHNTSTLDISDVDIIFYEFTLTEAGRLRKSTIDIIKEKLPKPTKWLESKANDICCI